MTIRQLINLGMNRLTASTSPTLDAEVLLSFVLDKPKEHLLANPENKVGSKLEKKYLNLISHRRQNWPIAYLTKQKEFYKLKFYVNKHVLVPRPETEGLIDLVIQNVRSKNAPKDNLKILDIGTGSGNIIISLAKNLGPKNTYFASDASAEALTVARKNAKTHKTKILFKRGSLLHPWKNKNPFNIIVANLPYLPGLVDDSTRHEPKTALLAPKKGLKLYEDLFKQLASRQHSPSALFLEIGSEQGKAIKKLAAKWLPAAQSKIYKDLYSRDRYASIIL